MEKCKLKSVLIAANIALAAAIGFANYAQAKPKASLRLKSNLPLYADFPDPDIIRVGKDFYFATTTFANTPGITILHSTDLKNWEYAGHVIERLEGDVKYNLENGGSYRKGAYAPSLRYYNGTFYVAVTLVGQNTKIYSTKNIKGPWKSVDIGVEAFDPALFIEDDGKAYLATSGGWDGTISMLTLNSDLTRVIDNKKVYYNKGAEGSKIVKRGKYYYLFNSIPNRLGMTVSRATSLFGPWETKNQIDDKSGGHQGAIVELENGDWFGYAMQDFDPVGRVTRFSPIFWQDDWPYWGEKSAPNQIPDKIKFPIVENPKIKLATSDDFSKSKLGLQWQWNHNPINHKWSLTERSGFLTLHAMKSDSFWLAKNTLTQKGFGPRSYAIAKIDFSKLKQNDKCGFGAIGKYSSYIAANINDDRQVQVSAQTFEDTLSGQKKLYQSPPIIAQKAQLYLKVEMDFINAIGTLSFGENLKNMRPIGENFKLAYDWRTGTFQGPQYAIFCFSSNDDGGAIDVDNFEMRISN